MEFKIRDYRQLDRPHLVKCMEGLQDHIVSVDEMKFYRRLPEYGEYYTRRLLETVNRRGSAEGEGRTHNDGVIYVAEYNDRIIGVVAGIVYEWSGEALFGGMPQRVGRTLELFVDSAYRGRTIGTMLMEKIEQYFKQNGCDVSRVEVFEPNVGAYHFYEKLGYRDRTIDMMKKL